MTDVILIMAAAGCVLLACSGLLQALWSRLLPLRPIPPWLRPAMFIGGLATLALGAISRRPSTDGRPPTPPVAVMIGEPPATGPRREAARVTVATEERVASARLELADATTDEIAARGAHLFDPGDPPEE